MTLEWIRHGDVALVRTAPTTKTRKVKRQVVVLAEGEITGHAHKLEGEVWLGEAKRDWSSAGLVSERELVVQGTARLTHEEHATVEIAEGTWIVRQQREFWGEIRNVLD